MSDYTVETFEHNCLSIEIWQDDNPENPLDWATPDDRQGRVTFALKHNRYDLPFEIDADTDDYNSWTELAEAVTSKGAELAGYNYKFVRWYEHSGISVSLRDDESGRDWDAGIAGVVFAETSDDIDREFQTWAQYIEGEVYGFTIENPRNGEVVDACGGYYGIDDVKSAAEAAADEFEHPHDAAYAKNATIIHGSK